jgi:tetratricopeptide (TPR) repeat protein
VPKALEQEEAARADEELAERTPAAIALDHYLPGVAAVGDRNYAEAIKQFEAALRVEPTHYWSLLEMGDCLLEVGQDKGEKGNCAAAVAAFTGCIMKRPDYVRAYLLRARAYAELNRHEEAFADNTKGLELDPTNVVWNNRGNVCRYWNDG